MKQLSEMFKALTGEYLSGNTYTNKDALILHVHKMTDSDFDALRDGLSRIFAEDGEIIHDSDCATYNEPAYQRGECDCSMKRFL